MKGMRNLNRTPIRGKTSWIMTLLAFGVLCIALGFVIAANFNVIPHLRAESQPTMYSATDPGAGYNILEQTQNSFREIIAKAKPAVVTVETKKEMKGIQFNFQGPDDFRFFDPFRQREKSNPEEDKNYEFMGGSGFFVSEDGYILTNNHVVSDAISISITTDDHNTYEAELIGKDPKTDVALLKIKSDKKFSYLTMGNSDNSQIGDWVIAIGSPIRLAQTVTVGVISGKNREDVQIGGIDYSNFIQTDAAINFGNSGGPLLDIEGRVIGINTAIAGGANVTGIGFAIPSNLAKFAYDNLKSRGEVIRGWIGVTVQPVDSDMAKSFGLDKPKGALVNKIVKGEPAEKAGVRERDLILEIDGKEVKTNASLSLIIAEKPVGKPVVLKILRDGKMMNITVTPSKRPDDVSTMVSSTPSRSEAKESKLGLKVTELTPELRKEFGIPEDVTGVLVAEVMKNSKANEKGLFQYDVISQADNKVITSVMDLERAVSEAKDVILLNIRRPNMTGKEWQSIYVAVPVEKK